MMQINIPWLFTRTVHYMAHLGCIHCLSTSTLLCWSGLRLDAKANDIPLFINKFRNKTMLSHLATQKLPFAVSESVESVNSTEGHVQLPAPANVISAINPRGRNVLPRANVLLVSSFFRNLDRGYPL